MTATAYVVINNVQYPAELLTYTYQEPSQPLVVTFTYPGVTLSTLKAGDLLTFVQTIHDAADFSVTPCYWYGTRRDSFIRLSSPIYVKYPPNRLL